MAELSERTRVLQEMCVSEADIKQLYDLATSMPQGDAYTEAVWRIEHECKVHIEWAERRREFMLAEIAAMKPVKPLPPTVGPPIVRHATLNGRTPSRQVHAERFG